LKRELIAYLNGVFILNFTEVQEKTLLVCLIHEETVTFIFEISNYLASHSFSAFITGVLPEHLCSNLSIPE